MLKINIKKYSIMKKIIIIGAGAMGSAFAVPCLENQNEVTLVGTHLEDDLINKIKLNNNFHHGVFFYGCYFSFYRSKRFRI